MKKQLKEKCDLVNVISYAMRDFDDYLDECHEEEIPPIDTFEDFIADRVLSAGYRKQNEGEWKQTTEPLGWEDVSCMECSVCGESWVLDMDFDSDAVIDYWHFCPTCGSKMKGGDA